MGVHHLGTWGHAVYGSALSIPLRLTPAGQKFHPRTDSELPGVRAGPASSREDVVEPEASPDPEMGLKFPSFISMRCHGAYWSAERSLDVDQETWALPWLSPALHEWPQTNHFLYLRSMNL